MKLVKNTLQGTNPHQTPVWFMRQAGRYLPEYRQLRKKIPSFMDLCFHEDYATQITLQPLQRFDLDAAILFSDILVIPHALGQTVRFVEGKGPILDPIHESSFFKNTKEIDFIEEIKIPLKVLGNVRNALSPTKTVIGFSGSPWTIATYMLERGKSSTFSKINSLLEARHHLFVQVMLMLEEVIGNFLIAQIKAGADVIQIFDSWAMAVPIAHRRDYIVEPIRRLIAKIREYDPTIPLIYYGRGVSDLYSQICKGFSSVAFSVDENVPISIMKNNLQKVAPVQGNLDPKFLVKGGTEMIYHANKLLHAFRGTPYVFNLGHGILPQTPVDHVAELVDLIKERNSYQ